MKKLLVAGIVAAAFCSAPALAADLPVKARAYTPAAPVYDPWTGCYGGLNIGYGWERNQSIDLSTSSITPTNLGDSITASRGTIGNLNGEGWLGGGQIGCNAHSGAMLWGVESDIEWANMNRNVSGIFTNPNGTFNPIAGSASLKTDWFGTLRGRVGAIVNPNLLIYATGGLAYGQVNYNLNAIEFGPGSLFQTSLTSNNTKTGWVLGAGFEYAVAPNFTWKLEYQYIDLGKVTANAPVLNFTTGFSQNGTETASSSIDAKIQTLRVGFNWKFGDLWGKAPVAAKY
jgi:outer membrane immunogenic protein